MFPKIKRLRDDDLSLLPTLRPSVRFSLLSFVLWLQSFDEHFSEAEPPDRWLMIRSVDESNVLVTEWCTATIHRLEAASFRLKKVLFLLLFRDICWMCSTSSSRRASPANRVFWMELLGLERFRVPRQPHCGTTQPDCSFTMRRFLVFRTGSSSTSDYLDTFLFSF